jgi:hypothetical protein
MQEEIQADHEEIDRKLKQTELKLEISTLSLDEFKRQA